MFMSFPSFQRERYCAPCSYLRNKSVIPRGFVLRQHILQMKRCRHSKRAGAFLNSRCGRFGAKTHVGSQLMDFLNVFRFFHSFLHTFEARARLAYSDHAALLTYCSVPYIQLRLVLISLPGHRKLFCARLSRCSLVRFIAKVYCRAF